MSEIKFTEDELKELNGIQSQFNALVVQFGQVHVQKMNLDEKEKELTKLLDNLKDKEKELAKKLSDKYGPGQLNPETGVFTPAKEGQPQQQTPADPSSANS